MTLTERVAVLENRFLKIEQRMNEIIQAINRLASLEQINQIATILETDQAELRTQLETLETRVVSLEVQT